MRHETGLFSRVSFNLTVWGVSHDFLNVSSDFKLIFVSGWLYQWLTIADDLGTALSESADLLLVILFKSDFSQGFFLRLNSATNSIEIDFYLTSWR